MFQTELDIFGIGKEKYLTLEFPLYEALVAILYRLFFFHDLWGRVVSLIAGYIGAWYLMRFVILVTRNRILGIFSMFFFLSAPLSLFYHRAFMIEPTIIACLIAGLYYSCQWIDTASRRSYLLGLLALTAGFVQKGLYGPFWLLPIAVFYWKKSRYISLWHVRVVFFLGLFLIPMLVLFLWQRHINIQNAANGQLFFTTDNAGHLEWNFGFLADRLSWSMWQVRIQQVFNGILLKPGLPLFLLGLWYIRRWDSSYVFLSFFVSALLYVLVVFRIQAQNYYQLILAPPFAVILSVGLYALYVFLKRFRSKIFSCSFCALYMSVFLWRSWVSILPSFFIDWTWYERLRTIDQMLPKHAYGIFATAGNEWNSSYTYFTRRVMKQVGIETVSPESIVQWKEDGYSFLFLHEPERYPDYLQQVAPDHDISFIQNQPLFPVSEGIKLIKL